MSETYEVYAIKYGHHDRYAHENFIGGDPHDELMPLDYFIWAIVGASRTFVVDTGFDERIGEKRGRQITRLPGDGLQAIGIRPERVEDVVMTHLHFDHAGNHGLFPHARFHLQDREIAYSTGRCMCHTALQAPYEFDDVANMVRRVFERRVQFHDGTSEIAPGITLHLVGGHSDGLQVVRVRTRRGWVVLASDASHLYANIDQARPFPVVYNVGDMLEGYETVKRLADSPDHIVPGHDPAVLDKFPAPRKELQGWVAKLDEPAVG